MEVDFCSEDLSVWSSSATASSGTGVAGRVMQGVRLGGWIHASFALKTGERIETNNASKIINLKESPGSP